MSDSGKAVFLSYASQDAAAAKRIADALRGAGVEVWFDTDGGLEHGDEWDAKIRRQIKECVLFIAVISANTQAREEGYFRIEWDLAAERARGIASGVAFILPVVIDDTKEAGALVPDRFRTVQWTRLPGGNVPADVLQRFLKLWSHRAGVAKHSRQGSGSAEPDAAPSHPIAPGPRWVKPTLASAIIVIAVLAITLAGRRERAAPPGARAGTSPAQPAETPQPVAQANDTGSAPASPARQLAERAWTIVNQGSLTRAQLDAAGELSERALQLDSTEAIVWARAAATDLAMIYPYGYDRSDERRRRAQERAARATSLGPDVFEVRVIQAMVFAHAVGTPALLVEAEKTLRELTASHPHDGKLPFQLAEVLREQKRFAEAARLFESVGDFEVAGWSHFEGGQLRAALADVERSLQEKRSVTALQLKAILQVAADEDLAAAQATIDQLQPSELLAEMPATVAMNVALYRRDPARVLELARGLGQDYLDSNAFHGPRQFYTSVAYELAGQAGAAEREWRAGLAVVEARLTTAPDDRRLLLWAAWFHAALNEGAEAERLLARSQALAGLSGDTMNEDNVQTLLRLRRKDALLDGTDAIFRAHPPRWEEAHAEMRFSPLTDWLRGDPRFEKQLHDNLPPGAKPLPERKAADSDQGTTRAADAKSVAVLAFADLSAAHDSEYFSDGISEELLNVLAKIPDLKVSARTSAFSFKGKEVAIPEIARQLGVAYVVEGSVRKQGDKVRITAQLIKAADGFHVWSDTFTRDLKDIFVVQDEIAALIAQNLSLKLGVATTAAGQAVDPEAYRLMLLGRDLLYRGAAGDLDQAQRYLQDAVGRDKKFALAWAWLSIVRWAQAANGWAPIDSGFRSAREAAEKALALQPNLPEANTAVGFIYYGYDWDWARAQLAFDRAVALAPGDAAAVSNLTRLAVTLGKNDEAVRLGRQAVALDPLNSYAQYVLSMALLQAGRYAELEQQVMNFKSVTRIPAKQQVFALVLQGKNEEALRIAGELKADNNRTFVLALAHWACGHRAEADASLARLKTEYAATAAYQIAELHAYRGETDEAFTWLDTSYRQRDTGMIYLKNDPWLKNLHADPRWPAMLGKMNLADASTP